MIGTECEYSVELSHDDLDSLLVCPHGWVLEGFELPRFGDLKKSKI